MLLADLVFLLLLQLTLAGRLNEYYGNDFYLGALKNYESRTTKLWITVSTDCTSGSVQFFVETLTFFASKNVSINHSVSVELPLELVVEDSSYLHRSKGIHVYTHDPAEFISVVLFNWQDGSVGDYLSIPCKPYPSPVEGSSAEFVYYLLSTQTVDYQSLWSETLLIGCQDDTVVTVAPSKPMRIPINPKDSFSPLVDVVPGQEHSFVLDAGQTLFIRKDDDDISGTEVRSNKPLSVVSGHECSNVPSNVQWCEHLTEQIPPTDTWGNAFLLVPFKGRNSDQYFKLVTKRNLTTVSVACNSSEVKNFSIEEKGGSHLFSISSFDYCYLLSSKPILIAQLASGGMIDDVGDPIMIILPPMQQYVQSASLSVLGVEDFSKSYVNIATTGNVSGMQYDGRPLEEVEWVPIYDVNSHVVGYSCSFDVAPGTHTITHTSGVISATLYGFHSSPKHRGYGHALGSQLNPLSESLVVNFVSKELFVMENHSSVVIGILCTASFLTNASVLVKTIPPGDNDFKDLNQVVWCDQGETHKEVNVVIHNDNLIEPPEQFMVIFVPLNDKFISVNTSTTVTIIDDDSVEAGFLSDIVVTDDHQIKLLIGIINGTVQLDASVDLVVRVKFNYNGMSSPADYTVSLTNYVPTVQVNFDLSSYGRGNIELNNCSVVATLSAEESRINVILSQRSLSYSVMPVPFSSKSSSITGQASTSHTTDIQPTGRTSTSPVTDFKSTSSPMPVPTDPVKTVYVTVLISEIPASQENVDLEYSTIIYIGLPTAGIAIILLVIIIAIFVIALKKKSMRHPRQPIPGVTNPCQVTTENQYDEDIK